MLPLRAWPPVTSCGGAQETAAAFFNAVANLLPCSMLLHRCNAANTLWHCYVSHCIQALHSFIIISRHHRATRCVSVQLIHN
jgi:hypothetical protein